MSSYYSVVLCFKNVMTSRCHLVIPGKWGPEIAEELDIIHTIYGLVQKSHPTWAKLQVYQLLVKVFRSNMKSKCHLDVIAKSRVLNWMFFFYQRISSLCLCLPTALGILTPSPQRPVTRADTSPGLWATSCRSCPHCQRAKLG